MRCFLQNARTIRLGFLPLAVIGRANHTTTTQEGNSCSLKSGYLRFVRPIESGHPCHGNGTPLSALTPAPARMKMRSMGGNVSMAERIRRPAAKSTGSPRFTHERVKECNGDLQQLPASGEGRTSVTSINCTKP